MRFVQKFTLPDFQAKSFTLSSLPYFNSFSYKSKKMSEHGEIYTGGKNFILPQGQEGHISPLGIGNLSNF